MFKNNNKGISITPISFINDHNTNIHEQIIDNLLFYTTLLS